MRVRFLDSFRVLAIFLVMLYHYFSRFYNEFYTYSINTDHFFEFGFVGVEFFFIISGFVIFISLKRCKSFKEFALKRYVRLAPGMLLGSLLTFLVFYIIKPDMRQEAGRFANFLCSNTFIAPGILNRIFPGNNLDYTDGAYWSIWVEITFYTFVGAFYFLDKKQIIRNFSIFSLIGTLLYFFIERFGTFNQPVLKMTAQIFETFNFFRFALWFLAGIYLSKLYEDKTQKKYAIGIAVAFVLLAILNSTTTFTIFIICTSFLLYAFIYKNTYIAFLDHPVLTKLGIATYTIYLIHQNLGVLFIHKLSPYLGSFNILLPILAIIIGFALGAKIYNYGEKPLENRLKNWIFKKT